jgi:ABC-type phosphate transport system substrate-binding protein
MASRITRLRFVTGLALALSLSLSARAEVVAVVSAKSAVQALARNHITDIFLGRKSRYPDGQQAVPLDQEVGSPSRDAFYTSVVGISEVKLKAHWSKMVFTGRGKPPRAVSNGIELRRAVALNPQAIGYIDRSLVDDSVRVLHIPQP